MTLRYSALVNTDRLTSLNTDIGINAKLAIYSGAQPASVATAASGTLIVTLPCNATAFGTVSGGQLTAGAITTTAAAATATAGWFRLFKADGVTAVVDGSVGTAATDIILNSTAINVSQNVSITSFVITGAPV